MIPFALQRRGEGLRAAVESYHAKARGEALVDYSFHLIVTDPTPGVLGQELPALVKDGCSSFKVFMTYDDMVLSDRQLLDVFDVARREDALVMVHAEGFDSIRFMADRLEAEGRTEPAAHAASRPEVVEREATHRAIALAELAGIPIMVVHVSGREAIEQIEWARRRGLTVHAETCPQYLVLSAADLDRPGTEGAKFVCSPPPRDAESQAAVWRALAAGTFQTFSSDHCPFRYDDDAGKTGPAARASFRAVPNGIPGVAARLPILFSEGVVKGRITLQDFVALTATNHARLYGLYPRKGSIAIGSDADIALWDPARRVTLTQELMHHGSDYTPYEGAGGHGPGPSPRWCAAAWCSTAGGSSPSPATACSCRAAPPGGRGRRRPHDRRPARHGAPPQHPPGAARHRRRRGLRPRGAVARAVLPRRPALRRPVARGRAAAAGRPALARHRHARARPAVEAAVRRADLAHDRALVANGVAVAIGMAVGTAAGYWGGFVGAALMRFTDLMMAFPALLLAIVLAALLHPSLWIVALVIALVNWVQVARIVYTETRGLATRDFILAERSLGAGPARILGRHILPHLLPTAIVWGTLGIATTVLLEATLSFLGVGVQPPMPSWGNIIFESQSYFQSAPWLVFCPGAVILLTALSFNLVGDALRDLLDPMQRGRG